jgi:hypothetical protein
MISSAFRLYAVDELGADGYPPEWHATIKHQVREDAGHRCVRCLHPYHNGEHGTGEWSPCDERCQHGRPFRVWTELAKGGVWSPDDDVEIKLPSCGRRGRPRTVRVAKVASDYVHIGRVEAQWRILTVHHLDINKANCRWWNLVALCQRCHLQIQGKVQMARIWPWEHTEWFRPYVAGYYASSYLGEELDRAETLARLDELLGLERAA